MKRIYKWVALFVVSVLLVCSFSGCGMLDEETGTPSSNGGSEKGTGIRRAHRTWASCNPPPLRSSDARPNTPATSAQRH